MEGEANSIRYLLSGKAWTAHPKGDGGTELLNTRKQAGDSKKTLCKHSKDKKMECLPQRMTARKYLIAELRFLVTEHRSSTKQGRIYEDSRVR